MLVHGICGPSNAIAVDAPAVEAAAGVCRLSWGLVLAAARISKDIRYEPDERCPPLLAIGVGAQGIMIGLAPTVLVVAITALAAGQGEQYLAWTVCAALIIVGVVTALQAARFGRVGAGHAFVMGVTPNFIAISVLALDAGGPATLASLIVLSALFFLVVTAWLPLLRRIITPVVAGTVLMLVAAMVIPIAFDRLQEVPAGTPAAAGPCVAAVTLVVATMLVLRAPRSWRPWSPLLGIAAGCAAAAPFGLYDIELLFAAPWVGLPAIEFPGLDLTPTAGFWALLPMFLIVSLVQVIKGIGDSVVMQQVARRRPRATDFRRIQGSMYANGVGMLLSGLAGTPPTTFYSASTVSLVSITGGRRAQRWLCHGGHAHRAGVAAQVNGCAARHSQPGDGRLLAGHAGTDLRRGGYGPSRGPASTHKSL